MPAKQDESTDVPGGADAEEASMQRTQALLYSPPKLRSKQEPAVAPSGFYKAGKGPQVWSCRFCCCSRANMQAE